MPFPEENAAFDAVEKNVMVIAGLGQLVTIILHVCDGLHYLMNIRPGHLFQVQ